MAWDAATIEGFIDDVDGQATAWYTAVTGTPVVLPGTPPAYTQQQLTAIAGARAAETSPLATYALAAPASFAQPTTLLVIGALIVLLVVLLR